VAFTYLKIKSTKCLCLLPMVLLLVLLYWSWSWSCKQRSWCCSSYFGLGLGLKNLVLFTSVHHLYLGYMCSQLIHRNLSMSVMICRARFIHSLSKSMNVRRLLGNPLLPRAPGDVQNLIDSSAPVPFAVIPENFVKSVEFSCCQTDTQTCYLTY